MRPVVVTAYSFEYARYDSLGTYCHSHTTILMALILSPIPFIRLNSITKSRFHFILWCHSLFFRACQCFREGAKPLIQNHRLLPGVNLRLRTGVGVDQILSTPAPTLTPAKTIDSDRLQLRSQLRLCSPGYLWENFSDARTVWHRKWVVFYIFIQMSTRDIKVNGFNWKFH